MATRGNDRQTREQRERARAYQARVELHERQGRRRTRDNAIAPVVGLVVILGAIGAQTAYFVAGPGMPAPEPTSTPAPSTPAPSTPATETPATPAPDATESTAP
ncbi:dioxygenase [Microbacterium sp. lyk4-40-TSB-66]|uniref:dioxygenase n=1 Tax=Microbacterium sp. lyk4-40-TSB-66 TaxID=3040294 RepID=UPI00254FE22C|nr:dioxygenase [Microbacterium sp. lyk4-40-TSB-66]